MATSQFSPSFYVDSSDFGSDNTRGSATSYQLKSGAAHVKATSAARLEELQRTFVKCMEYFGYKEHDVVNLDAFTAGHLIRMQTFGLRLQDLMQLSSAPTFQQLFAMNVKGLEAFEKSRNGRSGVVASNSAVQQTDLTCMYVADLLLLANSRQLSLEDHTQMASFFNFTINDLKGAKSFRKMRLADVDSFTTEMFGFTDLNNLNLADISLNLFFKLNIYNLSLQELLSMDLDHINLYDLFQRDATNYKNKQSAKINFNLFRGSQIGELNLLVVLLGDLFHLKNFNTAAFPAVGWLNTTFDLRLRQLKKLANGISHINVEYLKNNLSTARPSASQIDFSTFGRIPSRHSYPGRPAFYDEATNTLWDGSRGYTWNHLAAGQKEAEPAVQSTGKKMERSEYISKF